MLKKLYLSNKQDGWILIDALVGIVIVVTALTALLAMYSQATKATTMNQAQTNAMYIAQRHLEELKQLDGTPGIAALPESANLPAVTENGIVYTIQRQRINVAALNNRMHPFQIIVSWTDTTVNPAVDRQVQITSYYYQ